MTPTPQTPHMWGGGLCGGPNSQFFKLVHIGNFLSLSAVNTYLSKKIVLFHKKNRNMMINGNKMKFNVVQKVSKSPWTPTLTPTKTEPHTDPHTLIIACGVGWGGAPPPHHKKPHKPHTRCPPQIIIKVHLFTPRESNHEKCRGKNFL